VKKYCIAHYVYMCVLFSIMPPPKRPKSDVHWTTLCADTESRDPERRRYNVDVSCHSTPINSCDDDDHDAMMSSSPATRSQDVSSRPAISAELPLSLQQATADWRPNATGTQHPTTSSTMLRLLLLEPLPPEQDAHKPASLVSPAPPCFAFGMRDASRTTDIERPTQCWAGVNGEGFSAHPDAVSGPNVRRSDAGKLAPPTAALRRIQLNSEDADDKHRHPSLTADDCLSVQRPGTGGPYLDRPLDFVVSAPSTERAAALYLPATGSAKPSRYAQLTDQLEARNSNESMEQRPLTPLCVVK